METEFSIEYNNLVMNFANGFIINGISGLENPEIRISRDDLTGLDGGNIWSRLYSMRGIAIEGSIFGEDADEYLERRRAFSAAFNKSSDDWFEVTLWNGQARRTMAKAIKMPEMPLKENEVSHAEFRCEVLCEDPYWQDTTQQEYTAGLSVPTGLEIPFVLPATMAVSDVSNTVTIDNTGDVTVYPYIKITGAVNTPVVTNITTGETFTIDVNITSGHFVELFVDTRGKVVLYDSTEKYWHYLDGDFITIQPGVNQITLDAATYSDEAELFVRYSNKYESI